MKPGYYISDEKDTIHLVYPLNLFCNGKQRMEIIWDDAIEEFVECTDKDLVFLNMFFQFQFLEEL